TLQWVNPRGFTIFFNSHRALKDQRYKLLHHSRDELSIQLSNVTVQDSGTYRCFYYSSHFKNKSHNVQILAAPSQPVLEVSQDSGRGIKLSCHTQGCRPQPQISWLLDNGIELQGDTRHRLGADGGKWSTSSTLRILSYSPKVTASCIIQHPALGGHRLVASVPFQDLPSTAGASPSTSPEDPKVSNPSASPENPEGSSPSTSPKDPSPSASPKAPEVSSSSSPEDPSPKGRVRKEKNLLLPVLVAALVLVLLIIVLLFLLKLKKAHGVWKRENDVSEQTLESYKSRSNEDSPGHEKNGQ
ncbi:CRTAM protein, partial [Zosterops hypoxanthus]|nr:CRTAM protein [Zosterops hypoxanthus]